MTVTMRRLLTVFLLALASCSTPSPSVQAPSQSAQAPSPVPTSTAAASGPPTLSPSTGPTASPAPSPQPSAAELRFDVVNQSHRKVEVFLSGDPGSAMDGFLPGQSGTLTVASQDPHGAVQLSVIAYPECTALVEGPLTGAPMTVILFDNPSGDGGVILRTEPPDAASPIPAPSNNFLCMSG
jgi:hypothetical protein